MLLPHRELGFRQGGPARVKVDELDRELHEERPRSLSLHSYARCLEGRALTHNWRAI
jgi:hypothetical protein